VFKLLPEPISYPERHMKMIRTSYLLFLCLFLTAQGANQPNIVLFMADDMGMGDTSAFQDFTGNADEVQLHTPNMERLAYIGVRFTDAHTPSSRCTTTRYSLLTGRYSWRNRLKYWVLFGVQGDPLIEKDRPTIASMLQGEGYRTAMFGKWHVGLRYRRADGTPAAGWEDADLNQPLFDGPLDHGFDVAQFTSRSHGTSGPDAGKKNGGKSNGPKQSKGPGHIHGRTIVGATSQGKQLVGEGGDAYVLTKLGSRHSDHAVEFLRDHLSRNAASPFFIYYPANANHGPYTPDAAIGGKPVAGASRTKSGKPMDARHDLIYENDVALGRLIDWLEATDDPRSPEQKMIHNTLVIFTSDNGAEKNSDVASGPFRSHKGSCFEGGHRVPFIAAWAAGGIKPGTTNASPIGLQDLYSTFAEIVGSNLPDLRAGEKGAEDSLSVLAALKGERLEQRAPLFFNDHSEMKKADNAVAAMRVDDPTFDGTTREGQWKIFYDARLLRAGEVHPFALYELKSDQWENINRIDEADLKPLIHHLNTQALLHRNSGGHRIVPFTSNKRLVFDWRLAEGKPSPLSAEFAGQPAAPFSVKRGGVTMTVTGVAGLKALSGATFSSNANGLGLTGGKTLQVDSGVGLTIDFDRDVIVESAAIVAGNGVCGGFYTVGDKAPLAIYCVDADNDAKGQQGILSDIGVLLKGETLRLDSRPHVGVEAGGQWRLGALTIRILEQ
jgi:arylsulfatase A